MMRRQNIFRLWRSGHTGGDEKISRGAEEEMILTYKVKHYKDFSEELHKAKQVAEFAVNHRTFSSKDIKHLGLKSMIANQILRKYGRNRNIKKVTHIKLTVPNQGIKVEPKKQLITVPCLKLSFHYEFPNHFEKINQIEVGTAYIYISLTIPEKAPLQPESYLGVDLNTTGHSVVVANPETGKVWKLSKRAAHIHKKYQTHRMKLQKARAYKLIKKVKDRERRIIRDTNHKLSEALSTSLNRLIVGSNWNISMESGKPPNPQGYFAIPCTVGRSINCNT